MLEGPDERALGKVGLIYESKVSKSFDCRDGFFHKGSGLITHYEDQPNSRKNEKGTTEGLTVIG